MAAAGCRIKLHFLPADCPHLNPIERLWGVMHKNITHNKNYGTRKEFAEATLDFLRDRIPQKMGEISQYSHRQFSCDIAKGFSGCRVNRVGCPAWSSLRLYS